MYKEVVIKDDKKNKKSIHFTPAINNVAVRNEFSNVLNKELSSCNMLTILQKENNSIGII